MSRNRLWLYDQWYHFLEAPSDVATSGLLDPLSLESYRKVLSASVGHQLISKAYAWLGADLGMPVLYIASICLFAIAVYYFTLYFSESKLVSFLITFILVNSDILAMSHVGACGHLGQSVARDYLGLSFFVIGVYFLLRNRLFSYGSFSLLGTSLHMSLGLFIFLIMLPYIFLVIKNKRFMILHCVSFVIFLGIFYLYTNTGNIQANVVDNDLFLKWMYFFNGGHIFWDHSIAYWQPTIAFTSILASGLSVMNVLSDKFKRFFVYIIPSWLVVALISTFFIYVYPLTIMYRLTPLRSSLFVTLFVMVGILQFLMENINRESNTAKNNTLVLVSLLSVIMMIAGFYETILLGSFLTTIQTIVRADPRNRRIQVVAAMITFSMLLLFFCKYTTISILMAHIVSMKFFFALAAVSLCIVLLRFVMGFTTGLRYKTVTVIVKATVSIFLLTLVFLLNSKYIVPLDRESVDRLRDYKQAGEIIRNSTSSKDPILTAPLAYMPMVEVVAQRGSILQVPKCAFGYMAPGTIYPMMKALTNYGVDFASYKGNWITLLRDVDNYWLKAVDAEAVREISKTYHTRLLLTYHDHNIALPVLYDGKYFRVYKIY